MYIGGHYKCIFNYYDLLIAIDHIRKAGGNVLQIFIGKNTSTTIGQKAKLTNKEFIDIKNLLKSLHMHLYIHASLSLNLSNPLINRYHWILTNLIYDMDFAHKIGAKGVVVHLGVKFRDRYILDKYDNADVDQEAMSNMVKSLEYVIINSKKSAVKLLLETSAGQKNKIATKIEELGHLYHMINIKYRKRIGF